MSAPAPPPGPAVAPVLPGAPVVKKTERPHPLTPFIRGWLVLVALIIGFGRQLLPDGNRDNQLDLADLGWLLPVIGGIVLIAAAAGFFTWYYTRFVIDDEELRIETGALFKTSKKIPFERLQSVDIIQPMAARIFGLVELRLEAGAGDSTVRLRYLKRIQADRLRNYLLTRAHGQRASLGSGQVVAASALTDLSRSDRPLVKVPARRLVLSFVLSTEWLISFTIMLVVVVVTVALHVAPFALTAIVPLVIGTFSLIGRRVISMFNFTLAESPRGLRVTRGLTNLTSQSVPVNRIQGVKTTQPLLWKALGWYRVDVDIIGYARSGKENDESHATSVLLPVADDSEVALAIGRVLPGIDLNGIERRPSPRRAGLLRWFDFWTLRYGWNDRALITEHGWLTHVVDIVPHAKTQSVRIEQGPLQRRLGLADVHIDTPKGPVNAVAIDLDVRAARELALSQLDRARAARAADRDRQGVSLDAGDNGADGAEVLAALGVSREQLIGEGGESEVFSIGHDRVLRLYRTRHEAAQQTAAQLRSLYDSWRDTDLGIELPVILDSGERAGRFFTIDRRFSGRGFSSWLRDAPAEQRRPALLSYLDATARLSQLPSPIDGFARLIGAGSPQRFGSLGELLQNMLAGPTQRNGDRLQADLPGVGRVWQSLHDDLARREVRPRLVHGDVCPANAYVSLDSGGQPVVTGIGDFSPHTMCADPLIDVTGAVAFLELESYPEAAADATWLTAAAVDRWGPQTAHWIEVYRRFYGFYFSDAFAYDVTLYRWCLRQLGTELA